MNGKATQVIPSNTIDQRSADSMGRLADGNQISANNPKVGRNHVIRPGCSLSNATSMKRNEEPQMPAAVNNKNQSRFSKGFSSLIGSGVISLPFSTYESYRLYDQNSG